jgi:tRNA (guanine37-N1)-methyltransferase
MRFDVVTLFPEMFAAVTQHGISRRAFMSGLAQLHCWNPRSVTTDPHRTVDDRPYGGGPGMVMLAEPIALTLAAVSAAQSEQIGTTAEVVYLSPHGETLSERLIQELGKKQGLTLLCGRYEGIDQRVIDSHVTRQVSIGDFVVSGGELPAMVLIDALVRRIPGALNTSESAVQESFVTGLLDWPHYTRPVEWRGREVPPVLLSGDHAAIAEWRLQQAQAVTARVRPDLLKAPRIIEDA